MFFNSYMELAKIAMVGTCAYLALVVLLRTSGKRTLSKMSAFDFVVTVALGSILATTILSKDTALADGVLAFGLLIFLQFIITWLSARSNLVCRLVKAEPKLLYHQGEFLHSAMKNERVSEGEILQAMRSQGIKVQEQVAAVVLENDGSISVVKKASDGQSTTLAKVS